eukprot:TRINITY_DN56912_c0_g1_i1.p1 TRINITY_DN56912_c0_g1~~TRINITY_DN56912_c0_g1_i1.p1  ORF type:complete len:299 (-),score=42.43 TRINITY_DN56912_c0_g1_i1:41-937(-)
MTDENRCLSVKSKVPNPEVADVESVLRGAELPATLVLEVGGKPVPRAWRLPLALHSPRRSGSPAAEIDASLIQTALQCVSAQGESASSAGDSILDKENQSQLHEAFTPSPGHSVPPAPCRSDRRSSVRCNLEDEWSSSYPHQPLGPLQASVLVEKDTCVSKVSPVTSGTAADSVDIDEAMVCTMDELPAHHIVRSLGVVRGLYVHVHIHGAAGAAEGGELADWTTRGEEAQEEALVRLRRQAAHRGANAVVGLRYDITELCGATRVLTYGTAVWVEAALVAERSSSGSVTKRRGSAAR